MKITNLQLRPEMALAWAQNRKCRTQRVITKLKGFRRFGEPISEFGPCENIPGYKTHEYSWQFRDKRMRWHQLTNYELLEGCPYGQPGDRLRLMTTWAVPMEYDDYRPSDLPHNRLFVEDIWTAFDGSKPSFLGRTRMGRYMPRWLRDAMPQPKILSIRARRIQEITKSEMLEEGIREVTKDGIVKKFCIYDNGDYTSVSWQDMPRHPIDVFVPLWDSINAKRGYPWELNPWVWDIRFQSREEMEAE